MNDRAKFYRRMHDIPESWGTAVNVQSMVFGNMGDDSATGVAFTRNPSTGDNRLYGEFLINAQGEDVVAGIRTPQPLTKIAREEMGDTQPSMEEALPEVFSQFKAVVEKLETPLPRHAGHRVHGRAGPALHAADPQRQAHRQGRAADRRGHGQRGPDHPRRGGHAGRARRRWTSCCTRPSTPPARATSSPRGLPASPGAATGKVVFTAEEAEKLGSAGEAVILVREETSPEDIHGMDAARGIVTARGGMTSHAAVVARGMGRPCVSGAGEMHIDTRAGEFRARGKTIRADDIITIDGSTGEVLAGRRQDDRAGAVRRLRHPDGLGRRGPPPEGPRQRRDRRSTPRPRASSAPRASACAAPSTCSSIPRGSPPCAR